MGRRGSLRPRLAYVSPDHDIQTNSYFVLTTKTEKSALTRDIILNKTPVACRFKQGQTACGTVHGLCLPQPQGLLIRCSGLATQFPGVQGLHSDWDNGVLEQGA